MTTATPRAGVTQAAALVVYGGPTAPSARITQTAALTVSPASQAASARVAQAAALVVSTTGVNSIPRITQNAAVVVYATGAQYTARTRAWAFTLDGHPFYVLNLGKQGTYLFDLVSHQWCQFLTDGYDNIWDMINGVQWGDRVVGGSSVGGYVWELDPAKSLDEDWAPVTRTVTGALATRGREYHSVESVMVAASTGDLGDIVDATIGLSWSDDNGATWSDTQYVSLVANEFSQEIAWRSLGSFASPGRIFRITDFGGPVRIDGADAMVDGFDEDPEGGKQ